MCCHITRSQARTLTPYCTRCMETMTVQETTLACTDAVGTLGTRGSQGESEGSHARACARFHPNSDAKSRWRLTTTVTASVEGDLTSASTANWPHAPVAPITIALTPASGGRMAANMCCDCVAVGKSECVCAWSSLITHQEPLQNMTSVALSQAACVYKTRQSATLSVHIPHTTTTSTANPQASGRLHPQSSLQPHQWGATRCQTHTCTVNFPLEKCTLIFATQAPEAECGHKRAHLPFLRCCLHHRE
jgi:hypothetical protein